MIILSVYKFNAFRFLIKNLFSFWVITATSMQATGLKYSPWALDIEARKVHGTDLIH